MHYRHTIETYRESAHSRRRVLLWSVLPVVAATALALACLLPLPAQATPTTTPDILLQGEVKQQVDDLQGRASGVQKEIDSLDEQVERLAEEYNRLNVDLDLLNADLTELRRRLREAEDLQRARQNRFNKRLADAYKSGNSGSSNLLTMLLSTQDFTDFLDRLFLITKVTVQDQILVEKVRISTEEMTVLAREIETKKDEALVMRRRLEQNQAQIEGLLSERRAMLDGLDTQIAEVIEQERKRQEEERRRLEAELRSRLKGWELYTGPLPQIADAILRQTVDTAATYLGVPYVWGGEKPGSGFDCSGFLQYVYRQHGVSLPHYSGYQAQLGIPVPQSQIAPGDLIAFGTPVHHVGMYIGDGLFIHAPRTGDVVRIQPLAARSDINTIRRFALQSRVGAPAVD